MLLVINQQPFASNNNTTKDASLENLINNYYNIYLSNSVTDGNISYYSFFQPKIKNSTENIWSGMLVAFFVDNNGNLREDSNGNLRLDSTDAVINLSYDLATDNIKVTKSAAHSRGFNSSNYSINEVSAVWNTDKLATASDNTSKLGAKKYNEISLDKRYMLTQIDNNLNLLVNNICTLNYKYFDLDIISCYALINYLYGKPDGTQRSKIKSFSAQDRKIIHLGDIAHSELVIAGKPKANYDYLYQDASYAKFKKLYQYRRKVLYVGANDGMLHAFNAGFYNSANGMLSLTGKDGEIKHPLGSELWAYAPTNLLPHLKYLTSKGYNHKFFVDGSLQIVDAQIFSVDEHHPDGWGTVLIVAMGLGGSSINLLMTNNKQEFSSAYILLDITNPEVSPQVIAEISHKQLGFTLSKPAIVRRKIHSDNNKKQNSVNHNWYLVFASGLKNNSETFNKDSSLKIFIYDLKKKSLVTGFDPKLTEFSNCYAGDIQKTDWNNSNEDDFVYFGALYTNNIVASSSILRLKLATPITSSTISTLVTNLKPIVKAPLLVRDKTDYWIFAGSGRLLTKQDILNISNQFIYGIREPLNTQGELSLATVDANKLVDVTDVAISTTGAITSKQEGSFVDLYIDNHKITEFNQLEKSINNRQGWKLNLDNQDAPGCLQLQPQRVASLILFPEFKPRKNNYFVGDRYVHVLHYKTGTSSMRYQVKSSDGTEAINNNLAIKKIYAGIGYSSSNYIQIKTSVKSGTKILIPNSSEISIVPSVEASNNGNSRLSWRRIK